MINSYAGRHNLEHLPYIETVNASLGKENDKCAVDESELQNFAAISTAYVCSEDRNPLVINRNSNGHDCCTLVADIVKNCSCLGKKFYLILWRDRMQLGSCLCCVTCI